MSVFEKYTFPGPEQPTLPLAPVVIDQQIEWEVDQIIDSRVIENHFHYLVQWKGDWQNSWEKVENLAYYAEKLWGYHILNLSKPKLEA